MQQIVKATAIAGVAIALHGCGSTEKPKEVKSSGLKFMNRLNANQIEDTVKTEAKKLLKHVQFRAAASNLIASASAVIPEHAKIDEYVKQAVEKLNSFEGDGNQAVKEAYNYLYGQLKGLGDVNTVDAQAHKYFKEAMNYGHTTVIKALDDLKNNKPSIDSMAANLEKFVKDNTGAVIHTEHAVADGLQMLTKIVARGQGVQKEVQSYVDDNLHLTNHMMRDIGNKALAGQDIVQIEKNVRGELKSFIGTAEDGLKKIQKQANDVLKHRVQYINKAKNMVNDAQNTVNNISK